jgi:hypothetical protein
MFALIILDGVGTNPVVIVEVGTKMNLTDFVQKTQKIKVVLI